MAREFWAVAQAVIRLAPESPEALKLTGGVILRDLTIDECRTAVAEHRRLRAAGEPIPLSVAVRVNEYHSRRRRGTIETIDKRGHYLPGRGAWTDGEIREAMTEYRRLKGRDLPIPEEIRQKNSEGRLRQRHGQWILFRQKTARRDGI